MAKRIDCRAAAEMLKNADNICILCHQSPDGDTMGSAFALYHSLTAAGKRVKVRCSDKFPEKFSFLWEGYTEEDFEPEFILAVDIADVKLFGEGIMPYADRVKLCIDHHGTNVEYAENLYLEADSAATCELVYLVIREAGLPLTERTARCLYTGIATDTGCFCFECTTPRTHEIAAELIRHNIGYAAINRKLFTVKSRSRIAAERAVLDNAEYFFDGKCAMIIVSFDIMNNTGLDPVELDGIATLPMQIEGVEVGVTLKQKGENTYKVSMRSGEYVDVSQVCAAFGGGGHKRAGGCLMHGSPEEIKARLAEKIAEVI